MYSNFAQSQFKSTLYVAAYYQYLKHIGLNKFQFIRKSTLYKTRNCTFREIFYNFRTKLDFDYRYLCTKLN